MSEGRLIRDRFSHLLGTTTHLSVEARVGYVKKRKEKRKYVARPGIEPRTPDLRVRCPTDCATRPGHENTTNNQDTTHLTFAHITLTRDHPSNELAAE